MEMMLSAPTESDWINGGCVCVWVGLLDIQLAPHRFNAVLSIGLKHKVIFFAETLLPAP